MSDPFIKELVRQSVKVVYAVHHCDTGAKGIETEDRAKAEAYAALHRGMLWRRAFAGKRLVGLMKLRDYGA